MVIDHLLEELIPQLLDLHLHHRASQWPTAIARHYLGIEKSSGMGPAMKLRPLSGLT